MVQKSEDVPDHSQAYQIPGFAETAIPLTDRSAPEMLQFRHANVKGQ